MSDAKTLIINLKTLGNLERGIKLNTREKYFTLDDFNWYQGAKRFYRRDDRTVTYEKISFLIRNISELINGSDGYKFLGRSSQDDLKKYMVPILKRARGGLGHLQATYEDDKTFVNQIDVEISIIQRLIENSEDRSDNNIEESSYYEDTSRDNSEYCRTLEIKPSRPRLVDERLIRELDEFNLEQSRKKEN